MANIPHKVSLLPTTWLFPCKYRSGAINRLKQSYFFFRFTVSIDCVFFFFVVALQAPYLLFFKSCTWSFLNFFFNVFFSFDFVDPHVTQYKSYLAWLIYEVKSETVKVLPISTSFLRRKVWLFSQRDFRRTAVRGDIMWENLITSQRGCICSGNCLKMSLI